MKNHFSSEEIQSIEKLRENFRQIKSQLKKKIIGHDSILDQCLIAIFSGGHCLIVGVPGLGKTLIVQSVASLLSMKFSRVQFTPDLMPADIMGTQVISKEAESQQKEFKFLRGPVFTNLFLADEINRTPPKTQAALMEAMEEKQVSVAGVKMALPKPFFVIATQNVVESEGIYPLPYAQLDRFMFQICLEYPSQEEEQEIVELTTGAYDCELSPLLSPSQILGFMEMVKRIHISDELIRYSIHLARATRPDDPTAPSFISQWVQCGASPRGPYYIIIAAKAWALLKGKTEVDVEDIAYVASAVLEHRLIRSYHAQVERITSQEILKKILATVPQPGKKKWRFFSLFFGKPSHANTISQ